MITRDKLPPSCIVDDSVILDPTVQVGDGTVISGDVEIKAGVQLGRYCVLEGTPGRKTIIGSGTVLDDYVRVHPGVSLGEDSQIDSWSTYHRSS